jgi:hypothetical protein
VNSEETVPVVSKTKVSVNEPNLETRAEKLERKRLRRLMWWKSTPDRMILANISVNHMDYGMSPAEHLRAKQERENNS